MEIKRTVLLSSVLLTMFLTITVLPVTGHAQRQGPGMFDFPPGLQVHFVVPDGTPITTGSEGDTIIFTARSMGTTEGGSCIENFLKSHIQMATIIDPGAERATHSSVMVFVGCSPCIEIIVPEAAPVRPGTRLGNLEPLGACSLGASLYQKYSGVVQ